MGRRIDIQLLDGVTKSAVDAVLIEDVSDAEVAAADDAWKAFMQPILENRAGLVRANFSSWYDFVVTAYYAIEVKGGSIDAFPENTHWDWRAKTQTAAAGSRTFGIESGGEVQGLMLIRTDKRSVLTGNAGQPLVYVDDVATAPWNLKRFVVVPKVQGVGLTLIGKAIEVSDVAGWNGRIGLHALPDAEDFYRKCGMTDLGIDRTYQDLRYFEMSATQARAFMGRRRR